MALPFVAIAIATNDEIRDALRSDPIDTFYLMADVVFVLASSCLLIWMYIDAKEFHRRLIRDRTGS